MAVTSETRNQYQRRWVQLDTEFQSWKEQGRQISQFILPRSGRFLSNDRNKGQRRHNNILDGAGTRALRVLGAGLLGGATSPARPWFRITTAETGTGETHAVKQWHNDVRDLMLNIFARSNTYRVLHSMYEELGAFGTAAALVADDFENTIHLHHFTYGEYRIATNDKGIVDTFYREFDMTVGAMVGKWGLERCSQQVQNLYRSGNVDAWVTIVHCIEPRPDAERDPARMTPNNMPFKSVYYEKGTNSPLILSESGFRRFRVLAPRWQVSGGDIYGNSPGQEALGHVKQLQHEQLSKAKAIDHEVDPAVQVPISMKNRPQDRLPGGVSYYDPTNGANNRIERAFNINLRLDHLMMDIQDVRQGIRETFYTDLFLMLSQQPVGRATATEIVERHEEKLLMLGPVLERLHNELLNPLIEITFERMLETGQLPPPPPELENKELKIEYVSILAQAQRAISTNAIDRFLISVSNVAAIKPNVLDRFNEDKWADAYADMLGVDPELITPLEEAEAAREARAQRQQAAEQAAAMQQMAGTAQTLSQTSPAQDNALGQLLTGYTGV